jgi:mevalonate kinase
MLDGEEMKFMLLRIEKLEHQRRVHDDMLHEGSSIMEELVKTQKEIKEHQLSQDYNINAVSKAVEDLKVLFAELTEDIESLKAQLVDFLKALSAITLMSKALNWFICIMRKWIIFASTLVGAVYILVEHGKEVWKWLTNT